ncbi:OmpA family protein [Vibrio harveyi]|nr:OmpA family protein [Vibrio harveyi]
MKFWVCFWIMLITPAWASERLFQSDIDNSNWVYKGQNIRCEMTHRIADFGTVEFLSLSNGALNLRINPDFAILTSLADIKRVPATWADSKVSSLNYLGRVDALLDGTLILNDAQPIFDALQEGGWVQLDLRDRENASYQVVLINVSFDKKIDDFEICRSKLLPIDYFSARNITFEFNALKTEVNRKEASDLQLMAKLIRREKSINSVLVDGYASDTRDRVLNMRLSKQRAEGVAAWLIEYGVPRSRIEVRWHGDRYPLVEQPKPNQHTINNRVLVRLVKRHGKKQ